MTADVKKTTVPDGNTQFGINILKVRDNHRPVTFKEIEKKFNLCNEEEISASEYGEYNSPLKKSIHIKLSAYNYQNL